MFTLALLSAFGVAEFFGLGEVADDFYTCTHPSFFVTDNENRRTGMRFLTLKGVLSTPQQGFMARFQFLHPGPPEAQAVIAAGQPASPNGFGRGLPSIGQLQINESFQLPEGTGLLHVQVEGLSAAPFQFTCDLTKTAAPAAPPTASP